MNGNDRHLTDQQFLLSKYVRTGDETVISDLRNVRTKGIKYYRQLIFSIVKDAITTAYPIMTDFFGDQDMHEIISRFFARHECREPKLWAMPGEFFEYVNAHEQRLMDQYPFLYDLMLFEWTEVLLYMMPDIHIRPYTISGSIFSDRLVVNPEYCILPLKYPVFLVHPGHCTEQSRGEYRLLMYRHPETKDVIFCATSYTIEKFLNLLVHQSFSFRDLETISFFDQNEKHQIKNFIPDAIKHGIILGFSTGQS